MKLTTLCFLHTNTDILLAMKKRSFGAGKMNGVGGKVQGDETPEQALVREAFEEIEVTLNEDKLDKVAIIHFAFDNKPDWDQECHVYFASEWEGEPTESEEMKPEWYSKEEIPYEKMWADDAHWLPKVLAGEKIRAHFFFNDDQTMKEDFAIEPLVE
ncbi:MAG: hypothetical protein QG640_233 [Patescibacteria group bacterium]|nr:hypothetical protein [Patescibacteria group bacterium]